MYDYRILANHAHLFPKNTRAEIDTCAKIIYNEPIYCKIPEVFCHADHK